LFIKRLDGLHTVEKQKAKPMTLMAALAEIRHLLA
jgi:hypothetical protein